MRARVLCNIRFLLNDCNFLYPYAKKGPRQFAATPFLIMPEIYKPTGRYSTGTSWPSAPIFITSSSMPPTTS